MNFRFVLVAVASLLVAWLIVRFIRAALYPLRGKVVLITGGSRGLGLVLARHICARGGNVALIARDPEELGRAKADLAPHSILCAEKLSSSPVARAGLASCSRDTFAREAATSHSLRETLKNWGAQKPISRRTVVSC